MLRKIYNYVSTAIIIILILVIILISKSNSKKNDDYSDWISREENYITVTAKIGNVYKNVRNDAVVGLNSSKFKSYTISNSKIRDDLHSGSIIQPSEYLDKDLSFKIDYLAKIESIESVGNNSNVIVSDYRNLSSTVKIEEKYARYIEIGDTVNVAIDEISLEGKITNHSYNIVDGYLLVDIEYESSSVIYPGSKVEVDVLIDSRKDVLVVDKSAVIYETGEYFVNVLNDNVVNKTRVDIGLYGNDVVEIKSGIKEGTKVVLNQYE